MLAQVESGLDGQPKRLINQSDARNEPVELVTSDQVYDGDSGSELSVLSSTMFEGDAFQFLRDAGGLDEKTNETRRLVETNAVLKARACEMCNWRSIICKPLASSPVTPPKQSLLSSLLSHRQPDSQPHKTCGTAPLLSSYPVLRALVCQLRQVDLRNLMLTSKRLYALLNDGDFARRQAVLSGCTVGPCTINLRRCQSGKQEAERNGSGRIVLSDHVQDKTSVCRCCGRETCPSCTLPSSAWIGEARRALALRFLCAQHATKHLDRIRAGLFPSSCTCAVQRPYFCAPCEMVLIGRDQKYAFTSMDPPADHRLHLSSDRKGVAVKLHCPCGKLGRTDRNVFCDMCGGQVAEEVVFTIS